MLKAMTLSDAIAVFDPRAPLEGEALREFYVPRPGSPLDLMEQELLSLHASSVKVLFSGHTGSGKSTELNRLAEKLGAAYGSRYEVVPVNVNRYVSTLTYQDIMLSLALALFKRAGELEVVARAPAQAVQDLLDRVRRFLYDRLFGLAALRVPSVQPAEIGAALKAGVAELEAKYSLSPASHENLQRYIDQNLDELLGHLDDVAGLIWAQTRRKVLFTTEGTDKTDLARAREIFLGHSYALTAFRQASAIYSFPISLRHSSEWNQIKDAFGLQRSLPNFKLHDRDGKLNADGYACLERIITNRLAPERLAPDALKTLVTASGGAVRFLIRMMRNAATRALARGAALIEAEDARAAVGDELGDFIRMLRSDHYPVLWDRHRDKTLSSDPVHQELLQMSALLEYSNGHDPAWCDVHPILLPEVKKRTGHAG